MKDIVTTLALRDATDCLMRAITMSDIAATHIIGCPLFGFLDEPELSAEHASVMRRLHAAATEMVEAITALRAQGRIDLATNRAAKDEESTPVGERS